jgi:hypothetical protein
MELRIFLFLYQTHIYINILCKVLFITLHILNEIFYFLHSFKSKGVGVEIVERDNIL